MTQTSEFTGMYMKCYTFFKQIAAELLKLTIVLKNANITLQ